MPLDLVAARRNAEWIYAELQARFPMLRFIISHDHPHVDVLVEVPIQSNVRFPISMNLQGDEFHLNVGHFWFEWFPGADREIAERYLDAVAGVLSGDYRIVEEYIGGRAIKACLQVPVTEGWRTLAIWSNFGTLIPWPRRRVVFQNR